MSKVENMSYNEMKAFVADKGIEVENQKKDTLVAAIVEFENEKPKRGRPINPNSARQKRLANVGKVKRGRPADPNSPWNKRQKELAEKRANGTLHRGRPINPNSARQKKLAERQAKIEAGIEVKRGRPAGTTSNDEEE